MRIDSKDEHEKFRELCALSLAGNLTVEETAELEAHIEECEECRQVSEEYRVVAKEGMPMLAARFDRPEEALGWDNSRVKNVVLERFAAERAKGAEAHVAPRVIALPEAPQRRRVALPVALAAGIAACLVIAVGVTAYRAGRSKAVPAKEIDTSADQRYLKLANEKQAVDSLLGADELKLRKLETDLAAKQSELEKLKTELRANEEAASAVASAKTVSDTSLQAMTQERDGLTKKFVDAEETLRGIQSDLGSLKTERDQAAMRSVGLQRQVDDLVAVNADQQRRIGNQDQYLSADRDIRELMGARKLYIADVFDVSSDSHTRKPYGRVFYTQGKSLIFYAFDLEHGPRLTNASTFQVWGKSESAQDRPVNLGVLYMDSEANRRWALRCDDPQQLAEIDAVFVTVEPSAHGNKPTGKAFLYASLRKEPNHP